MIVMLVIVMFDVSEGDLPDASLNCDILCVCGARTYNIIILSVFRSFLHKNIKKSLISLTLSFRRCTES